jgi:hypothetical protein
MKKTITTIHFILSLAILTGIVIEFYFAGMGVFQGASFQIHQITGVFLWGGSALLLLFALLGKTGKKAIGFSILLFVLLFIQPLWLQINQPFVKALHVVNGLAVLTTSMYLIVTGAKKQN